MVSSCQRRAYFTSSIFRSYWRCMRLIGALSQSHAVLRLLSKEFRHVQYTGKICWCTGVVCFKWLRRFVSICLAWERDGLLRTASSSGAWVLEMSGVEFGCSIRWRGWDLGNRGGWAHTTRKPKLWARLVSVLGSRNPSWAENSIVFNGLVFCDLVPGFICRLSFCI